MALAVGLAGCAGYPDLPPTPGTRAEAAYPRLLPLTPLVNSAQTAQLTDPTLSDDLTARVQRLRARADALRRTALTEPERQRIRDAVVRLSG